MPNKQTYNTPILTNFLVSNMNRIDSFSYSMTKSRVSIYVILSRNMFAAFSKGGRWPYFWLGTILHGLFTDNFWHFALPEYDNFWHSQTPIIFLGARLPLHIILLCKFCL